MIYKITVYTFALHYNKSKLYTVNFGIDYKLRLKDKFQLVSILMRAHDFVYEI